VAIRYDRSRFAIVAVCTSCGWQDLGVTKEAAWSLAADHERRAHPDQRKVRRAAAERNRQHKSETDRPESGHLEG